MLPVQLLFGSPLFANKFDFREEPDVPRPKIETITEIELDSGMTGTLGLDEDGRLYWNQRAVVTEQKVTFDRLVSVSVVITAVSTLAIAIVTALMYFKPVSSAAQQAERGTQSEQPAAPAPQASTVGAP